MVFRHMACVSCRCCCSFLVAEWSSSPDLEVPFRRVLLCCSIRSFLRGLAGRARRRSPVCRHCPACRCRIVFFAAETFWRAEFCLVEPKLPPEELELEPWVLLLLPACPS